MVDVKFQTVIKGAQILVPAFGRRSNARAGRNIRNLPDQALQTRAAEAAAGRGFLPRQSLVVATSELQRRGLSLPEPVIEAQARFGPFWRAILAGGRTRQRTRGRDRDPPLEMPPVDRKMPVPVQRPPQGPPAPPPRGPGGPRRPDGPDGRPLPVPRDWLGKLIGSDILLRLGKELFELLKSEREARENPGKKKKGKKARDPWQRKRRVRGPIRITETPIVLPRVEIRPLPPVSVLYESPAQRALRIARGLPWRRILPTAAALAVGQVTANARQSRATQTATPEPELEPDFGLVPEIPIPDTLPGFQSLTDTGQLTAVETAMSECQKRCEARKAKGKRRPSRRTVCYRGSYTETATGRTLRKKERVPCK